MGVLTRTMPAILLLVAAPARADDVARWQPMIDAASIRFGVPSGWIKSVMRAESHGMTILNGRPIRSRAGAIGLMQLMPATWSEMRARLALGTNPDDPGDNILAGTFYLRLMYDRFGYPGLFGAYNAGPGVYAAYLAGTRRPPVETIAYLSFVVPTAQPALSAIVSAPTPSLFAVRAGVSPARASAAVDTQQASLFALRIITP